MLTIKSWLRNLEKKLNFINSDETLSNFFSLHFLSDLKPI